MNLILCGMMGCGKSTVGSCLAKSTEREYFDTDAVIVQRHGKIADIFERFGETYFRALETQTVKELVQKNGLVISTGGGLVLKQENVDLLKYNGKIVFLRAKVDTLLKRLQADKERPLLQNATDLRKRLEGLLSERTEHYEKAADLIVDVDGKTPQEIVDEIIERMGQV